MEDVFSQKPLERVTFQQSLSPSVVAYEKALHLGNKELVKAHISFDADSLLF